MPFQEQIICIYVIDEIKIAGGTQLQQLVSRCFSAHYVPSTRYQNGSQKLTQVPNTNRLSRNITRLLCTACTQLYRRTHNFHNVPTRVSPVTCVEHKAIWVAKAVYPKYSVKIKLPNTSRRSRVR